MATRGGQGLARVAVVVRAGAAPLWWLGVCAAGIGVLPPGLTGRRIGVLAGAALFLLSAATVAGVRRKRHAGLARSASRAGKHDVLQDRAVTVRNWRRGHRWWLLLAFLAALGSAFALPAAGGLLVAGTGSRPVAAGDPPRPPGTPRGPAPVGTGRLARRARGRPGQGLPVDGHGRGRRRTRWGAAPPLTGRAGRRIRPRDRTRSSSAGDVPSPGSRGSCRAPGRGRGRCRHAPTAGGSGGTGCRA